MDGYSTPLQQAINSDAKPIQWRIVILAFLAILLDGFDTTSISFVVPTLAREWGMAPAAFTPAFVATNLGAVIGYMVSGQLAHRFGSRWVILCSVLVFAGGSMLTGFAGSLPALAVLRFITGIGLGAVLPAAVALAANQCPAHRREVIAVAVTAGIGLGSTFGGVFGGRLIALHGWQSVFLLGGMLPLLLFPFLRWGLPSSMHEKMNETGKIASRSDAAISNLFKGTLAFSTTLLWSFSFMIFVAVYALYSWLPTLLLNFGFSPTETSIGTACLGAGGLLGAILLMPLSALFGASRVLIFSSLLGAISIACVTFLDLSRLQLLLTIALIGVGLLAGTIGQSALAVALYPQAARATGVGYSAAAGRIGSILGPAVGGILLSFDRPAKEIILTACVPVLIAALAAGALDLYRRRRH